MILVAGNMAEWDFLFDFVLRFLVKSEEESLKAKKGEKQTGILAAKSDN